MITPQHPVGSGFGAGSTASEVLEGIDLSGTLDLRELDSVAAFAQGMLDAGRPIDIVLIVYHARALGEPRTTPEAVEVRRFAPSEISWPQLAFWSTELALRDALKSWNNGAILDRAEGL
jgi:hypothetical protein